MLRLPESWVWDSWYAFDGERHHAFYLRASRALGDPERRHSYPYIGHAVSTDLVNWTVAADAVAISDEPGFDSMATWTGSVVQADDGLWWMFYTGRSRADHGLVQRIGAATSSDLFIWQKVSATALVSADGRWYERLGTGSWPDEAWRDPFVFKGDDDRWHMYVTGRANRGTDDFDRGVVAHAVSDDLRSWEVLPPVSEPGAGFGQLEVIQVAVVDGVPTLLWCCGGRELTAATKARWGTGGMFSVTGPSIHGPFDVSQATRFPHESIYAARVVAHAGEWYLLGFRDIEDGTFVGELTDPIPVTAVPGHGLVPRSVKA